MYTYESSIMMALHTIETMQATMMPPICPAAIAVIVGMLFDPGAGR